MLWLCGEAMGLVQPMAKGHYRFLAHMVHGMGHLGKAYMALAPPSCRPQAQRNDGQCPNPVLEQGCAQRRQWVEAGPGQPGEICIAQAAGTKLQGW